MIAEIRTLDEPLSGDPRTALIRQALADGVDNLETTVGWLLDKAPSDPNVAGAAAYNLLMLAGTVLGGWQSARAALAVIFDGAEIDDKFAATKLKTVDFYAAHIMPRATQYSRAAMADSGITMTMPEASF